MMALILMRQLKKEGEVTGTVVLIRNPGFEQPPWGVCQVTPYAPGWASSRIRSWLIR